MARRARTVSACRYTAGTALLACGAVRSSSACASRDGERRIAPGVRGGKVRQRIVGLTGGIASGKSTVSRMLGELGSVIIDADVAARHVVAPGSDGLARIVEEFGKDVLL